MKVDQNTGEIVQFDRDDQLTEHFHLYEFCRGGALWPVEYAERLFRLARMLEDVRAHVGAPLKITSGYRTPAHNAQTAGSAKHSPHMRGYACDFRAVGTHPEEATKEAHHFLRSNRGTWGLCGLGLYPEGAQDAAGFVRTHTRIHADLRHLPFRSWTK